jgi:hypothetical protein
LWWYSFEMMLQGNIWHGMKKTWNCWNFSPSAVNCKRKFFSVANNCETCSAYNFIWDCSWTNFSSCCLIFRSASWSSSDFCFNCGFKFQTTKSNSSPLKLIYVLSNNTNPALREKGALYLLCKLLFRKSILISELL